MFFIKIDECHHLPNSEKHYPVLLDEILSIISPQNGGTFIDCTFGQGGYSKAFLKFSKANVIALDRDPDCRAIAQKIKLSNKDRFKFFHKNLATLIKLREKVITLTQSYLILDIHILK